ncbi:hemerythrin domain-containing protein [Devosia sp.]|jgi:hemerythrin-like domain-containing protein|uniref:hemerythrin domain-containing protein n=1 Tax=Devosia sp. TaxID=1871048 RepID=UPI0037BE477A
MKTQSPDLQDAFTRQMNLCDLLENIADSLPARLDRQQCLHVARMIGPLMKQAHAAEEALLFPQVATRHNDGENVIEKLRLEHIEDECFAEEVQYELLRMGQGQPVMAPEATGYMLRGFFEGVRRHIRHELELLKTVELRALN